MKERTKKGPVIAGLMLCAAALALSVVLQQAGYLTYLNSDMASEMILARRQADTGSLIQMDWLYSTEIHSIHMNLFYALAFLITPDYMLARIIGNTLVFMLGMGACAYLCRKLSLSWGGSVFTAAMLPVATSALYAANMTIGGYYIIHLPFAYLTAALWLEAGEAGGKRVRYLFGYLFLCMLMGLLSVRYVLCFVCPMLVVGALEAMLAPEVRCSMKDRHARFGAVAGIGFAACALGYAASEIIYPHAFHSGAGAASSFMFNPLDGEAMLSSVMAVAADFLKLLGWRGDAALFSAAGIVNLCIAAVIFLGAAMAARVYRGLSMEDAAQRKQKRMMQYALAAFFVNLFCFVFIKGTYLNRYLILAVLFLVPALAVALSREKSLLLRAAFLLVLCVQLALGSALLFMETREQEEAAVIRSADMMDAAQHLIDEGYTHGYGTFWNVRVIEERTRGALTFTGVAPIQTEEGAAAALSLDMIRWLEPDGASHIDACNEKTFLLLTRGEEEEYAAFLVFADAPVIYENEKFVAYGFADSAEIASRMLTARMKLENAALTDGGYALEAGGRMRVPTSYREAGSYTLRFTCGGEPGEGASAEAYRTSGFEMFASQPIAEGENEMTFTLEEGDKYFMLLFRAGEESGMTIRDIRLERGQ